MKLLPGNGGIASTPDSAGREPESAAARYLMMPDQIAASHYAQRLAFDDQMCQNPSYALAASIPIDDSLVVQLRVGAAGRLSAILSIFKWAQENERLPENVAALVKRPKPKRQAAARRVIRMPRR